MKAPFLSALVLAGVATCSPAAVDFRSQIWPILQKKCVECHRAPYKDNKGDLKNPKGALRLDGAGHILKGGSNGDAVKAGDPDSSSIYERVLLPQDHEDAMPPKGKGAPLTFAESELLKEWIIEGASFGEWKGADGGAPATAAAKPGAAKVPDPMAAGAKVAPAEAIKQIESLGALVGPVETGSPLLAVEWVSGASAISDEQIAKLTPLAANITDLNLSDTKITDEALKVVAKFTRLTRLNLSNTAVTDAGVAHLKPLANLVYLNLHSTDVSDASLASLTGLRKLRNVYLWKTRVTPDTAGKFEKSIPDLSVEME